MSRAAGRPVVALAVLVALLGILLAATGCPGPSGAAGTDPAVGAERSEVSPVSGVTSNSFTVLGTTPTGRALFIALPAARTLEPAIVATADELGKLLDGKPVLSGAFADSRSRARGGALFTGKLQGREVRGWIFSGTNGAAGATSSVVIAQADAKPADLQPLFAFMPERVTMRTHVFPDGSGSVDLPEGWTTPQTSATHGIGVLGPAGQAVGIGNSVVVNTPDGLLAAGRQRNYESAMNLYRLQMQTYRQNLAMHERYPNTLAPMAPKEPPAPDLDREMPLLYFCRYCSGPEEVLEYFYPVSERKARKAGGRFSTVDKVIEIVPSDPNPFIKGDRAGVVYMAMSDHDGDTVTKMRVLNRIETYPVGDGKDKWVIVFSNMRAPDATFERDLPVMNDIMASFKLNLEVARKQMQQEGDVIRKMGEENQRLLLQRGRDFNEQQAQHFQRLQSQVAAQSQARHDSNSDFIEYVSGVRHVYDSQTGQTHGVDLFNSNAIVESMNASANDPGRFVQIPLRYER